MKNKIRLFVGWFGLLTPVYAAGVVTTLVAVGIVDMSLIVRIVLVSAINCFMGRKILRMKLKEKGVKSNA